VNIDGDDARRRPRATHPQERTVEKQAQGWKCNRLGKVMGAEIVGLDLARPLDDGEFARIEALFHEHRVLVFRDQKLTPEQQIAFSNRFGNLHVQVQKTYCLPGYPEIQCISNCVDDNGKPLGVADAGRLWHTDFAYVSEVSRCSMLYAIEVPHNDRGEPIGDTMFMDANVAYERLSADVKEKVLRIGACHSYEKVFEGLHSRRKIGAANFVAPTAAEKNTVPPIVHPVIIAHPHTGEPILFVNELSTDHLVGVPEGESAALLQALLDHVQNDEFKYSHKWRVGDLLMWDNVATQHFAVHDYELPQRRFMRRTSVKGSALRAYTSAAAAG